MSMRLAPEQVRVQPTQSIRTVVDKVADEMNASGEKNGNTEWILKKTTWEETMEIDIQMTELLQAIKLSRNSAPGADKLRKHHIENLPRGCYQILLDKINQCWKGGEIPTHWTYSKVLLFIKKGKNPLEWNSYRPIALTSYMGKIMDRIILWRLTTWLE